MISEIDKLAASINSLKSDFEFLVSDNGLINEFKIEKEFIDDNFEFNSELSLNFSFSIENKTIHGIPNTGESCSHLAEASNAADEDIKNLTQNEYDKISRGVSDFLRISSGSINLTNETYFVVVECQSCSAEGKIPCKACNAKGQSSCQKCSGSGETNCNHCNGRGRISCSSCGGQGSRTEYSHSMLDNPWDTNVKNHGLSVSRTCTSCTGRGNNVCRVCNGYKEISCSNCSGNGLTTCGTCNGATAVTCNNCAGHGCNSETTTKIASLQSNHEVLGIKQYDDLIRNCVERSYDNFFAGARFRNIEKRSQNKASWNTVANNKYEVLSVTSKAISDLKVARFSSNNNTVTASIFFR